MRAAAAAAAAMRRSHTNAHPAWCCQRRNTCSCSDGTDGKSSGMCASPKQLLQCTGLSIYSAVGLLGNQAHPHQLAAAAAAAVMHRSYTNTLTLLGTVSDSPLPCPSFPDAPSPQVYTASPTTAAEVNLLATTLDTGAW
jgi:hypothetical protein